MQTTLLTHGSLNALPKSTNVTAGALTMLYEQGFLRYIRKGTTEVVRMINHTLRDQNWNTIPLEITSEKIESSVDSFVIEYDARCKNGVVDFQWKCRIQGNADSTINFSIAGTALSTFSRNRIGLTVLHPIETCSGKDCHITHPDGTIKTERFPVLIDPVQPFFDIALMAWSPAEGTEASCQFEGEVFETEDQRNWLDNSFKTYCTPLSKPMPVTVNPGDQVNQSVLLRVSSSSRTSVAAAKPISFAVDKDKQFPFPKIGIPLAGQKHTDRIIDQLKELPIDFLRLEVNVNEKGYPDNVQHAGDVVAKLNLPLEVVLFADEHTTDAFIEPLLPLSKNIIEFIVLPAAAKCTDAKLIRQVVPILRKHFPHCKIGGGTDSFFTELNRLRTPVEDIDFLSFSINPQAHAVDMRTMTENLQTHKYVVESCREFAGGKGIHVGPVTLKTRQNPSATSRVPVIAGSETLPSYVDPRQLSLYAAGWTMGSFKYLAEHQVEAITYYQSCGWAGLVSHPDEAWPNQYAVPSHCVYPVYLLLQELLRHKNKSIKPLVSSHPLLMDGVAFVDQAGMETILLANLTPEEQHIQFLLKGFTCRTIDAGNVSGFMEGKESIANLKPVPINNSIALPPFALVLID